MVKTEKAVCARIKDALRDARCKMILTELYLCGATRSDRRVTFRELSRRLGMHHYQIAVLVKGDKRHKAKLRGLVYYPDRGEKKGIYLTKAGIKLAKALLSEQIITEKRLRSIARTMATQRQHNGNTLATQWQHNGNTLATQWQHFSSTLFSNTLIHSNTLKHCNCQREFSKTDNEVPSTGSTQGTYESQHAKKRCECEKCHAIAECEKFKFNVFSRALLEAAPQAARFRNAWLCARCYKACKDELIAAIKIMQTKGGME
ncbi:MAG: hypothetical protein QXG57_06215 [Thermofilaceae archaeon]